MVNRAVKQLQEVLEAERKAICSADFDSLADLAQSKAQIFAAFAHSDPDLDQIAKVNRQFAENQTLLAAAIAGVKTARDRIALLQKVRDELGVYDQNGQMANAATPHPGLEKKA
ncbi:flagellar export chaperone FlgN [Yoonia sp.]|uniref:flagellar export chaperone FlgN n=1 Tax=Yoonia sp. TaxID=2212373 RepID=UPI001A060209|nr:flagellar export chaperone FlgN [Yoonia sp.]MBE0413771.1 flagellar export chaperone FlgN [Yoonia sp.]